MCYANAIDYDLTGLVVAESEEKAVKKYEQLLDEDGVWVASVHAEEITEVDGYKINLNKMDIWLGGYNDGVNIRRIRRVF